MYVSKSPFFCELTQSFSTFRACAGSAHSEPVPPLRYLIFLDNMTLLDASIMLL